MVYDSVYEMTNYLRSTVRKQHFWDYFSGAGISFTTQSAYNYTGGSENSGNVYGGSSTEMYGQKLDSGHSGIGKIILKVDTPVKKYGSPTGTATIRVYAGDGTTILAESSGLDVSTLTTSYVNKSFVLSSHATLEANSRVVIYYSGGDSSNYINIGVGDVGGAGSNTSSTRWNGSNWASPTTRDTKMTFDSSPANHITPSNRWTFKAGAGGVVISQGMSDSIDGGYELVMTNGHIGTYDFNNTRQFNYDGAVIMGVCKRYGINGVGGIGFIGDDNNATNTGYMDRRVTRLLIRQQSLTIQGMTSNASGATYHDTGVTSDNNYHLLKTELTSGGTHFSVDGVVGHSSTGSEHETDEKLQPMFMGWANGSSGGIHIRYMEAYNT